MKPGIAAVPPFLPFRSPRCNEEMGNSTDSKKSWIATFGICARMGTVGRRARTQGGRPACPASGLRAAVGLAAGGRRDAVPCGSWRGRSNAWTELFAQSPRRKTTDQQTENEINALLYIGDPGFTRNYFRRAQHSFRPRTARGISPDLPARQTGEGPTRERQWQCSDRHLGSGGNPG